MKWSPTTLVAALWLFALPACSPDWSVPGVPDAGADGGLVPRDHGGSSLPDGGGHLAAPKSPGRVSVPTLGAPGSVGALRSSGRLTLFDDGFEGSQPSCSHKQCLTGGISP